ncbi:hypothetical protein Tco_1423892 [Tanacetum coccineum]
MRFLVLYLGIQNSLPYDMIKELKSMFEKQARVKRFDMIQTFHACKQEEGKPVGPYILKMNGYVEQLEHLGYVLPQDISVGLILNGLTSDFAGFVRNYNMHNMGKTIDDCMLCLLSMRKDYALETAVRILNMVPTKKVDKTPNKLWYAEFLKKNLLSQEISGRAEELKEIQDEDTSPSENTSNIPMEVEEVEKHSLGDLNEPTNYKAEILDSKSDKWVDAMNAKMQSMKEIKFGAWLIFLLIVRLLGA